MQTLIVKNEKDLSVALFKVAGLNANLNNKAYDITIKEHKEKRSKNANDYSWVLQDKIAKALNMGIDELHKRMVLDYGVLETFSLKEQAFESAKRMFDYYKVLGESELNGTKYIHIRAGIGTHLYSTSEMSTFLEGVVSEAKNLGIETKTPAELEELKSLWGTER